MSKKTVQMPQLSRAMPIDPAGIDAEKRTAKVSFGKGARVLRFDYWSGDQYYEELSMDPAHVRMARFQSGSAPLCRDHITYSLDGMLGVIRSAEIVDSEITAEVEFSKRAEVEPFFQDVLDKIIRNASVGYRVYKMQDVTGPEDKIKVLRAIDWEPYEGSLVPVGADAGAGVRSQNQQSFPCEIIENRADSAQGDSMKVPQSAAPAAEQPHVETPATTPAPAATRAQEPAQPAATPVAADSRAALEIIKTVRKAGLQSEFAESLIEQGMTLDQARAAIIDKIAEAGTATVRSHVTHGAQDDQEMKRSGMESALMHRILPSQALTENGKRFRGMSVVRMAEEYLGERGRGLTPSETVTRSLSSSDFPLILGNVAEKMLMNAYGLLQKTFEPFVTPGTLRDYKPAYRYQVGDAPSLLEIKEGGEYKKGSFGEKAESMSLADYGRKLVFTRQMMINDDLGAFQRVIGNFGSSASRLESQLVYAILTGNPNMADGVALFHANHGNLAGATAITEAGLTAAEILLMNQKSLDNADYLNLVGKFLICGTAKKVEAQKMLASVLSAKSSDVNPFQNAYTLIVDPRVSGTKWFLATDPNALACIELARLEGETGPVVDSKESWDTDGIEVKCRHTVVAKAIEWKGIVYNPGA